MTTLSSQPFRRITVTVRREDYPVRFPFTTGVVLVDGQRVGFLIGGKTCKFHVPPGEHTIGVSLGGRGRLTTGPLRMEEGDRIDLVCGGKTGWVKRMTPLLTLLLLVISFMAVSVILNHAGGFRPGRWSGFLGSAPSPIVLSLLSALSTALVLRWWDRQSAPYSLRPIDGKKKSLVADV